jgi:hypothetical protein
MRPLISKEIIKIIEDVKAGCGLIDDDERRYTECYKSSIKDNDKLKVWGHPTPGAQIEIYWTIFEDDYDVGYIFTLPGRDSNDIWMTGIVHIPYPIGCEKQSCDPEWIYLDRLLANPQVTKVQITESN